MVAALNSTERATAALALLLVLTLFYQALSPVSVPNTPAFVLRPFAVPHLSTADGPALSQEAFSAITQRPLFVQTRRQAAPDPAKQEAAAAPAPPPNVYLVGVIADSSGSLALVRSQDSPLETSLRAGQTIGGWQIEQVLPDRMVLALGTNKDEVRLDAPHPSDATQTKTPTQQKLPQQTPSPQAQPPVQQRAP